jgi:DNA-binding CsgD family transcriptional regulator
VIDLEHLWPDPDRRDSACMRALIRVAAQPERWTIKAAPMVPRDSLTDAELRTLQAMSVGLSRYEAAEVLGVGLETVKDRLKVARRILAAKTTAHACCEALRQGLIR